MRTRLVRSAVAALAAVGLLGLDAGCPAVAAPTSATTIKPTELPRGGDVAGPRFVGKTLVDQRVRIRVPGLYQQALGVTPDGAYVVEVLAPRRGQGPQWQVQRITPDGDVRRLVRDADPNQYVLDRDGASLVLAEPTRTETTVTNLPTAPRGPKAVSRTFPGYVDVLDADGPRVVVGGDEVGGVLWNLQRGTTKRLTRQRAYTADLAHRVLVSYSADPYDGGCTEVARFGSTSRPVWTSCEERVEAISTDGSHLATVHILSDGLGPNVLHTRLLDGTSVADYRVARFFGVPTWEFDDILLVQAWGREQGAIVRCKDGTCERASRLEPVPVS